MTSSTLIISNELMRLIAASTIKSAAGFFWIIVTTLWLSYWPYILIFFVVWVIWELVTRNGGFHYNSENGFSPTFNRVVGAGVYFLFQGVVYLVISKFFGIDVYIHIWPYPIHLVIFLLTGFFLNLVGFWKYWKLP